MNLACTGATEQMIEKLKCDTVKTAMSGTKSSRGLYWLQSLVHFAIMSDWAHHTDSKSSTTNYLCLVGLLLNSVCTPCYKSSGETWIEIVAGRMWQTKWLGLSVRVLGMLRSTLHITLYWLTTLCSCRCVISQHYYVWSMIA